MTYGKNGNTGEGTFHLTADEVEKFDSGVKIIKETGNRYGDYSIVLSLIPRRLRDKDRKEISVGDYVIMPDPNEGDAWVESGFEAIVHCFKGSRLITVKDQDDEVFDVEADRVELMEG